MKLKSLIITVLLLLLSVSCAPRTPYVPVDTKNLRGSGKVYFVTIGDFPQSEVEKLTSYYRSKYGLAIETLPQQDFPTTVINSERGQATAESAIDWIKQQNPALANNPQAILIGLTTADMYIARYDWQFAFGWRQEGRYAIVSNARMSLGKPSAEKVHSRLRKMVTKNIGILYYKLRPSDDPRSVLYKDVGGISELDKMGEEF